MLGAELRKQGLRLTDFWSSPLVRAVQSAELLAHALAFHGEIRIYRALEPEGSLGDLLELMQQLPSEAELMLASHEPLASKLAGLLSGERSTPFHQAEAALVQLAAPEPGGATALERIRGS